MYNKYEIHDLALDPVKNFGKVIVSTGYDNLTTSIALKVGDGAKLPDTSLGAFNLVWWDSTLYSDPSDDPNVEIVRCTIRAIDSLIISRGQENTSPSNKNTPGHTYKMILSLTQKMITDIPIDTQSRVDAHSTLSSGVHGVGYDLVDGIAARNTAISNHAALTSSIHNFDSSGNAPPRLHGGESHEGNVQVKTTNYTATTSDDTILCNATSGAITITLPNSSARTGKIYNIKKTDSSSNSVTITRSGSDSIEGYNTKIIATQWGYYTLQSDGISNWIILSSTSGMASLGPFNESTTLYNASPQSGLVDSPIRHESFTYSN